MRKMTFIYWLVRFLILCFAKICLRLEIRGVENIPQNGGAIIAPNHVSYFDPPLVGVSVPVACHYFAKEELFHNRYFGGLLRRLFAIPVKRGVFDRNAMRQAAEILKNEGLLLFFPEGTRSETGELQDAKPGVSMLANQSGVPVVPVYVDGSYDVLPKGASRMRFHKVIVNFGKPVFFSDSNDGSLDKKTHYEQFAKKVMLEISQLRVNC